jgi:predicted nucleic acid-binding protein
MPGYVLDSWAVLCYLRREPGHESVVEILAEASSALLSCALSVINWAEVVYNVERRWSSAKAREAESVIDALPIEVIDVNRELAAEAARIKADHPIALAGCFAAALAHQRGSILVTGDPEFKPLEKKIRIRWLR